MPPKRTRSNVVEAFLRRLSSQAFAITGEAVTNAAGSAGTVQDFNLAIGPITNAFGNALGAVGDTSIALTHTAFTTEVAPKADADLANGEFYVDYLTGKARGKKATTATSGTADYKAFAMRSIVAFGDGTNTVPVETAGADAGSNTSNRLPVASRGYAFNGTTWDRVRSGQTTPTATLTGFQNSLPWATYHAAPTARTEGQGGPLESNQIGDLLATLNSLLAGEDLLNNILRTQSRNNSTYISTATTTVVKSGSGLLHCITVMGGTAGTIIVYDNTAASGTILASFDSTNALATYLFDVIFSIGCTVITSAATKLGVETQ